MAEIWPFESAVREIVELLLALREYDALERLSGGVRLTAVEMATAVAEHGRRLIIPPAGAALLDVVPHRDGGGWSVDIPLWTAEEGRSDLILQLTVLKKPGAAHRIEIDDIHVV